MNASSRIRLARVKQADAAELIAANCANRSYHLPWLAAPTDQAGFDQWFARTVSGPIVGLIARESSSDDIVGVINLNEIVMGLFKSAYLGYYGMRKFSRTGLMTEALMAASAFAFDELGLHRLEANIQPGNHASLALARRAGFKMEGYSPRYLFIDGAWRDHERWALLAD